MFEVATGERCFNVTRKLREGVPGSGKPQIGASSAIAIHRFLNGPEEVGHSLYFVNRGSVESTHQPGWLAARCGEHCVHHPW